MNNKTDLFVIRKDAIEAIKDPYTLAVYVTLCSLAINGEVELGTKELSRLSRMGYTKFKKCKRLLAETLVDDKPLIDVCPCIEEDGSRGYDIIFIK